MTLKDEYMRQLAYKQRDISAFEKEQEEKQELPWYLQIFNPDILKAVSKTRKLCDTCIYNYRWRTGKTGGQKII